MKGNPLPNDCENESSITDAGNHVKKVFMRPEILIKLENEGQFPFDLELNDSISVELILADISVKYRGNLDCIIKIKNMNVTGNITNMDMMYECSKEIVYNENDDDDLFLGLNNFAKELKFDGPVQAKYKQSVIGEIEYGGWPIH